MDLEITPSRVLQVLSAHIGSDHGMTAQRLADRCLMKSAGPGDLRRLRTVIQALRNDGTHVCGHPSEGYYIAANAQELDDTCQFLYDRAMSSLKQIAAMKNVSLPDLRGQLRLPT